MVEIKVKIDYKLLFLFYQMIISVSSSLNDGYSAEKIERLINAVNSMETTWTAADNLHTDTIFESVNMLGDQPSVKTQLIIMKREIKQNKTFPDFFDCRERWNVCAGTIGTIKNQGKCGTAWAICATSVINDRICIESNGTERITLSTKDLLTCCHDCQGYPGKLCSGGYGHRAFNYWRKEGIVTGGANKSQLNDSDTSKGCKPDSLDESYMYGKECLKACPNSNYPKKYSQDKHFAQIIYQLPYSDSKQIQFDIKYNGPVMTSLILYEDFIVYKKGVYRHVTGSYLAIQAVKILGWGVENNVKYWLCANSWSTDWGMEGMFKIVRGENHCHIEREVIAGGNKKSLMKRHWQLTPNSSSCIQAAWLKYICLVGIILHLF